MSAGGVRVRVDGAEIVVPAGSTVAAAVALAGNLATRRSPDGRPRGPLCGMGICYECRVTVDGRAHVRSCMEPCVDGQEVTTDA